MDILSQLICCALISGDKTSDGTDVETTDDYQGHALIESFSLNFACSLEATNFLSLPLSLPYFNLDQAWRLDHASTRGFNFYKVLCTLHMQSWLTCVVELYTIIFGSL